MDFIVLYFEDDDNADPAVLAVVVRVEVDVELSDGEMQEGSTWEAAMAASHFGLDTLVALIDCNGIQADGPSMSRIGECPGVLAETISPA